MAVYSACYRSARAGLWKSCLSTNFMKSAYPLTTVAAKQSVDKNEHRPLSPHMSIYKIQITSLMSLTHRATGLVLTGGLYTFSLGMLALPARFPCYMDYLQSLHMASPLIMSMKFALAWAFFFHATNGIRHLAWDMGYGFELKQLYTSGYIVLATSIGLALLAATM